MIDAPGAIFRQKCLLVATAVREAIEEIKSEQSLPSLMSQFPKGCCGPVSEILAKILEHYGIAGATYKLANVEGISHAWLETDDLVIDITGDQFPGRPCVYVGERIDFYTLECDPAADLSQVLTADEEELLEKVFEKLGPHV